MCVAGIECVACVLQASSVLHVCCRHRVCCMCVAGIESVCMCVAGIESVCMCVAGIECVCTCVAGIESAYMPTF